MRKTTENKHALSSSSSPEVLPYSSLIERPPGQDAPSDRLSFVKCANPFVKGGMAFGCSQCLPCRVNRRRIWTGRLMLEQKDHVHSTFVTLTYDDEHLPGPSLVPDHLRLFLYRLRKDVGKFRYFAVGEYGDATERPHYHVAFFGLPNCLRNRTRIRVDSICCENCERIREHWSLGNVYLGELNSTTAAYVAGYCTKKMTSKNDPRLDGRYPEFARMSNRPGIGANYMDDVASTLMENGLDQMEDVPAALRHGGRLYPLGRYLRRQLRKRIGRDEKAPLSVIEKAKEELRPLRDLAYAYAPQGAKEFAFKNEIIKAGEGRRIRLEARANLAKKRGSI